MTDQNQHIPNDQLQALLDGVLEPKKSEEVQSHLDTCPTCRDELTRLEALSYQLDNLPEVSLSRDLSGVVLSQLQSERNLSPAITWALVVEALAAGAVIAVLIPALQAAGWLPRLLEVQQTLGAALNLFLAQLASSWLVWWAELKLQLDQVISFFNPGSIFQIGTLSPWLVVGLAGGSAVLINALLLGGRFLPNGNHQGSQL